jgi:hypothetical protein
MNKVREMMTRFIKYSGKNEYDCDFVEVINIDSIVAMTQTQYEKLVSKAQYEITDTVSTKDGLKHTYKKVKDIVTCIAYTTQIDLDNGHIKYAPLSMTEIEELIKNA